MEFGVARSGNHETAARLASARRGVGYMAGVNIGMVAAAGREGSVSHPPEGEREVVMAAEFVEIYDFSGGTHWLNTSKVERVGGCFFFDSNGCWVELENRR